MLLEVPVACLPRLRDYAGARVRAYCTKTHKMELQRRGTTSSPEGGLSDDNCEPERVRRVGIALLPPDVVSLVLSHLPARFALRASGTCRAWHDAIRRAEAYWCQWRPDLLTMVSQLVSDLSPDLEATLRNSLSFDALVGLVDAVIPRDLVCGRTEIRVDPSSHTFSRVVREDPKTSAWLAHDESAVETVRGGFRVRLRRRGLDFPDQPPVIEVLFRPDSVERPGKETAIRTFDKRDLPLGTTNKRERGDGTASSFQPHLWNYFHSSEPWACKRVRADLYVLVGHVANQPEEVFGDDNAGRLRIPRVILMR
jgi:F-box domain